MITTERMSEELQMPEDLEVKMKPSPGATYEQARRLANEALWTIELQRRRLRSTEPEDEEFVFRKWADFQFLIVALTRLRRAATLATKVPEIKDRIHSAINVFDQTLPGLKQMRDTAEHIDDYAVDEGREASVGKKALEVGEFDDHRLKWLDLALDTNDALNASRALFDAIAKNLPRREF